MRQFLRHIGPAIGFPGWTEALRAAGGMLAGMLVLLAFLETDAQRAAFGLFLIAPFGASAVLVFAIPNSPLAQPWSALAGNCVSAVAAVAVVLLTDDPGLRIALAATLALFAMIVCRALHPPGGAVALTAALSPDAVHALGPWFVLAPVGLGTVALILVATVWSRLTGRRYPFRQPADLNAQGTHDTRALDRLGVSREELAGLLQEFRQSANIGVEDLARLIAAAELLASKHHTDGVSCAEIMSRDLVTVRPETPLTEVAGIFRQRGFTSLPVVDREGRYRGVIFQIHLIRRGQQEADRSGRRFVLALGGLLGRRGSQTVRAAEVMDATVPHLPPEAAMPALLPLLAEGPNEAVPVLEGERIVGIVTRTDLIAALAHQRGTGG
ncbi:HPP family protein [Pseudogemmobacter humi]|uniref:HPP family protein n=1 Tax=Pseudogemmobacter humi TaxID=2483812 RepID=A0A3P5WCJ0_9RHOB|nr:HPP family protein [Pseudogemmobacter humi]VDC21193.1 HPP family protein [Pseudogemmobacter humi]